MTKESLKSVEIHVGAPCLPNISQCMCINAVEYSKKITVISDHFLDLSVALSDIYHVSIFIPASGKYPSWVFFDCLTLHRHIQLNC